jgi:hypothetical protein
MYRAVRALACLLASDAKKNATLSMKYPRVRAPPTIGVANPARSKTPAMIANNPNVQTLVIVLLDPMSAQTP